MVAIVQTAGPATRQQLEAASCAMPRVMADGLDEGVPAEPASWMDVGGEPGVVTAVRYVLSGGLCRQQRVTMAHWRFLYYAELIADEDLFDLHAPDFETMLASWRWWAGGGAA